MKFLSVFSRPFTLLFLLMGPLLLIACSVPGPVSSDSAEARAARLGTQWGETIDSRVRTQSLKRLSDTPVAVDVLHYSAAPASSERLRELPLANGRVGLRILRENGTAWPIYRTGGTQRLQGRSGERYTLEYRNYSTKTYEIVATVDGLDVLSGQPGSVRNRGYVLRPGEHLRIKGFRKSGDEVAAFRFASVTDSYAANSAAGSPANVGVIGTAVFELNAPPPATARPCRSGPCAFPNDGNNGQGRYAAPPIYD